MTQSGRRCHNCGSISNDPDWCDVCGADLNQQVRVDRWLTKGDVVHIRVASFSGSDRTGEFVAESTDVNFQFPQEEPPTAEKTLPTGIDLRKLGIDGAGTSTQRLTPVDELATDDTLPPTPAPTPTTMGSREIAVALTEKLDVFANRRVWLGTDPSGTKYRVEERRPSPPTENRVVGALSSLIDAPVGVTGHGNHEVRVLRWVDGQLISDKLQERQRPLTPREVLEWVTPVIHAVDSVHRAGYVLLRICPYTVKLRVDGSVFFQGVEGLYRTEAPLSTIPAIPGYSAPEIYRGDGLDAPNPVVDIYSVAMLVYYLIAQRDPPSSQLTGYVPALQPRDFQPDFPLGFQPFFEAAASASPERRPQSMAAVLAMLRKCVERAERRALTPESSLVTAFAVETHTGILKRLRNPVNQDAVFGAADEDSNTVLIGVADGVSTASFGTGDLASTIARRCMETAWDRYVEDPHIVDRMGVEEWLDLMIQDANEDIVKYVNERFAPFEGEPHEVMGTTMVVALIRDGVATVASVGDSRVYLVRAEYIERVSRDHNLLTLGIVDGLDTDVAVGLPQSEALARCLGTFEITMDGHLMPLRVRPDVYEINLAEDDHLLLATDGLTDYAADSESEARALIHRVISNETIPDLACLELILHANRGGGGDNIGIAIAAISDRKLAPGAVTGEWTATSEVRVSPTTPEID